MSADTDRTAALRRELIRGLVEETGMREVLALPIANSLVAYLQRERPGQSLYIPAAPRQYDLLQIHAALMKDGATIGRVCRQFGLSRSTLYKLFPGGWSKPSGIAA